MKIVCDRLFWLCFVLGAGCASLNPLAAEQLPPVSLGAPSASAPAGAAGDGGTPGWPSFSAVLLQDPFFTGNDKPAANADEKKAAKEGPRHIRDNAFLVEEAFNQEPGDVQHIFNWLNFWDRSPEGRTRDFGFFYTMELPLGTQKHQFSFTTLFISAFEDPNDASATNQGGVSDTFLNYRYQLLADDDFLWCAPRLSLIVPTGDERFGLGTGQLGYSFNLPISRYGDSFDFHFNGGFTLVPNVSAFLTTEIEGPGFELPAGAQPPTRTTRSPRHDLYGYNLGASAYWKPRTDLHLFVEALALLFDQINDQGSRDRITQVFVNPGVRYAVCQLDQVEWVIGVSVPVGLTRDTPDIGVFAYMSIEHKLRKTAE